MTKRILRVISLFALAVVLLSSCENDMMKINSHSDYFIAKIKKADDKLQKDESTYELLPDINVSENYSEQFTKPDRLSIYEKEMVASSNKKFIFVNKKNHFLRGENVILTVAGSPNTLYTLKIKYKSGYSSAKGLGNAVSDKRGYAVWSFKISNVATSEDFTPWFEVSDGETTVKHYFVVGDDLTEIPLNISDQIITDVKEETKAVETEAKQAETKNIKQSVPEKNEYQTTSSEPETIASDTVETNENTEKILFINAYESYCRGAKTTLTVRGEPNTAYTLKIRYKSGYSKSKGLGDVISDSNGLASWTFKISSNADADFIPWFEVSGAGTKAIRNFRITDAEDITPETTHPEPQIAETAAQTTAADVLPPPETAGMILFIDLKQSYSRGENVTLTVKGLPNTVYTLKIKFKSGYSAAKGLGETTSGADGAASWSFKIGNRVNTDGFLPFFEVSGGGETEVRYFNVTD